LHFEGSEKKVELVISSRLASLRTAQGQALMAQVVAATGAHVLSTISSAFCDAWLLSESSLFLYDHKFILITCGRTRLVAGILRFLQDVSPDEVLFLNYERKDEYYPGDQPSNFDEDVAQLSRHFRGQTHVFGDRQGHHVHLFHLERGFYPHPGDHTLELLLHGLPAAVAHPFQPAVQQTFHAEVAPRLHGLLADFQVDEHLFEPYGYSLNAIAGERYFTIHVTPQEPCSYASFETNAFLEGELGDLIQRVIALFQPRSAIALFFCPAEQWQTYRLPGSLLSRQQVELACGYGIQFGTIESSGQAQRGSERRGA